MSDYLNSLNVRVYPTAYRRQVTTTSSGVSTTTSYNPESHLSTEFNITTLVTRLSDKDSFIIEYKPSSGVGVVDTMIVCIKGYWFELKDVISNRAANTPLYASIWIQNLNTPSSVKDFDLPTLYSWKESAILDDFNLDDGEFCGLKLSSSSLENESQGKYSLQLFDANGKVPESSRFKLSTNSIVNMHYDNNGNPILDNTSINRHLAIDVNNSTANGLSIKNGANIIETTTKNVKTITVPTYIENMLSVQDGCIGIIDNNNQYVWWVDTNGNTINASNNPQDEMIIVSDINDAYISYNSSSRLWEADYSSAIGKRIYKTASDLEDLSDADANTYKKIDVSVDGYDAVTFTFEN